MTANAETIKTRKSGKADVLPLTRDEQAKVNAACLKYAPLVKSIATEYVRPGSSLDLEDLMQLGYEALIKAVRDWREDGGATFATIANGDIRNALCTAVGVKREKRERAHFVALMNAVDIDERLSKKVFKRDFLRSAESLDEPYDDGETLRDLIGTPATQEEDLANKELHEKVIRKLSEDDLRLIRLHDSGATDADMAEACGIGRSTMQARRSRATKRAYDVVQQIEPLALVA
jgi:RNA polymerase sigma factor (sigma-70 family)